MTKLKFSFVRPGNTEVTSRILRTIDWNFQVRANQPQKSRTKLGDM